MFQFDKKPLFEVCGKQYECDITDNEFVEGLANDFPELLKAAQQFKELEQRMKAVKGNVEAEKHKNEMLSVNAKLLENCKAFIIHSLGQQAYEELFADRRPNSTEHLKLCTAIYVFVVEQRKPIVNQYLDMPGGIKNAFAESAARHTGPTD